MACEKDEKRETCLCGHDAFDHFDGDGSCHECGCRAFHD
jgi:hypothetical protein